MTMRSSKWRRLLLELNVDVLLDPFIPPNRLDVLPVSLSRFLGYRTDEFTEPPALVCFPFIFFATIAGLCLVGGISNHAPGIEQWRGPNLIASFGASAILDYNSIRSPLAQPRNVIFGHTIAAIVGVAISKLFQLSSNFQNIEWVAGAVGCACSSIAMSLANSLHPPGGATALLASTDAQILALGWRFPALVLLYSTLMTCVACIFNNIVRQYPTYWWTSEETGKYACGIPQRPKPGEQSEKKDPEKGNGSVNGKLSMSSQPSDDSFGSMKSLVPQNQQVSPKRSLLSQLPDGMLVSEDEKAVLERLESRLGQWDTMKSLPGDDA